jgi:hypothetical protein
VARGRRPPIGHRPGVTSRRTSAGPILPRPGLRRRETTEPTRGAGAAFGWSAPPPPRLERSGRPAPSGCGTRRDGVVASLGACGAVCVTPTQRGAAPAAPSRRLVGAGRKGSSPRRRPTGRVCLPTPETVARGTSAGAATCAPADARAGAGRAAARVIGGGGRSTWWGDEEWMAAATPARLAIRPLLLPPGAGRGHRRSGW